MIGIPFNVHLYSAVIKVISIMGQWSVVERIRRILADLDGYDQTDGEKRMDVVFVYCNLRNGFPDSDAELIEMYIKWIDDNLG